MTSYEYELNLSNRIDNILGKIESFKIKSKERIIEIKNYESSSSSSSKSKSKSPYFSNETDQFKCIIDDLNRKLNHYEEENKKLKDDNNNLRSDINNLRNNIKEKDEYIKSLKDEISYLKESLKNANSFNHNNNKVNLSSPLTPNLTESVVSVFPPSAPRSLRKKRIHLSNEKNDISSPSNKRSSDILGSQKKKMPEIKFEVINPIQFDLDSPTLNSKNENEDEKNNISILKKDDDEERSEHEEESTEEEKEDDDDDKDMNDNTTSKIKPNISKESSSNSNLSKKPPITFIHPNIVTPKQPKTPQHIVQPKLTPFQPKIPLLQPKLPSSQPKIQPNQPKQNQQQQQTIPSQIKSPLIPVIPNTPKQNIFIPPQQSVPLTPKPSELDVEESNTSSNQNSNNNSFFNNTFKTPQQPNHEKKNNEPSTETKKEEQNKTPSFFSKIFGRSKSETKVKSKEMKFNNVLQEGSFYFDKNLNMWVERGKEEEALKAKQPPPPPPKAKK